MNTKVPENLIDELKRRIAGAPELHADAARKAIIWAIDQSKGLSEWAAIVFSRPEDNPLAKEVIDGIDDMNSGEGKSIPAFFRRNNIRLKLSAGESKEFEGPAIYIFPNHWGQNAIPSDRRIPFDAEAAAKIELPNNPIYPEGTGNAPDDDPTP